MRQILIVDFKTKYVSHFRTMFARQRVTRHSEWSIIDKNENKKSQESLDITQFLHLPGHSPCGHRQHFATHHTAQVQDKNVTGCSLTLWTWWMAEKGNPAFWFVHISQTDDCWYKQKTISSCQYLKHGSYRGSIKEGREENNKKQSITFLKKEKRKELKKKMPKD